MSKVINFELICKAKNLEEADNILGNCLKDDSAIQLHGDIKGESIDIYSESATLLLDDNCNNIEQEISSMIDNNSVFIDSIEIE